MEPVLSSETSVITRPRRYHILQNSTVYLFYAFSDGDLVETDATNFLTSPLSFFERHHPISPLVSLVPHEDNRNIRYRLLQEQSGCLASSCPQMYTPIYPRCHKGCMSALLSGISATYKSSPRIHAGNSAIRCSQLPLPSNGSPFRWLYERTVMPN
jgi:hypothetical protein